LPHFFFHLFDEKGEVEIARKLASLLSPTPGSVIFGAQFGAKEKGWHPEPLSASGTMFWHSTESWKAVWCEEVFKEGTVDVEVGMKPFPFKDTGAEYVLWWSVKRL